MQWVLEDSEVAAWSVAPGAAEVLTLRFSAARVYAAATGKTGSGEGLWLPLQVVGVLSAPWALAQPPVGRLEGGWVLHNGQRSAALPLPCVLHQPVVLELAFAGGGHCSVPLQTLEVQWDAAGRATRSWQC